MEKHTLSIDDEEITQALARDLAEHARAGDLFTLSGDLGAGKTAFARAFIRHYLANSELEVPSPTYLIAIEHTDGSYKTITHMDLYRITSSAEIDEFGIDEALERGVVLIEWPQNAPEILPLAALQLTFFITGENTRELTIEGASEAATRCSRALITSDFLHQHCGRDLARTPFAADASARNYELIIFAGKTRLLMDAPKTPDGPIVRDGLPYSRIAHLAEDVGPFYAIANLLRDNGFRAPQIYAENLDKGLLLLEHLGEGKIIDSQNNPLPERYFDSSSLLAKIHEIDWHQKSCSLGNEPYQVPKFDEATMMIEIELLSEWYLNDGYNFPATKDDIAEYHEIWTDLCALTSGFEQSLVLRDYHSPNIIWQNHKELSQRIGLIDFQDALFGPSSYDLVSLAQDARIAISSQLEAQIFNQYVAARKASSSAFVEAKLKLEYAVMGAQRASKILGIFVRLDRRDNKPHYRNLLPLTREYLARNLRHPQLHHYLNWCERVIGL